MRVIKEVVSTLSCISCIAVPSLMMQVRVLIQEANDPQSVGYFGVLEISAPWPRGLM